MSKYTTELQNIILSNFDLGLDNYPIFSEGYRDTLNQKILNHYYFHEIGFETAQRFKFYLNVTMNEIMPYYNKLYQTELLTINPLLSFQRTSNTTKDANTTATKNLDNVASSTGSTTGTTNGTTNQNTTLNNTRNLDSVITSKDKDIFSDTPKNLLSLTDVDNNYYATDARIKTNDGGSTDVETLATTDVIVKTDVSGTTSNLTNGTTMNENGTETANTVETNVITENGFEVPLADLIAKYRETFLNIDMLVIGQLKDLFLMIY